MKVNPLYGQNSNYTCHISDFKLSETLTASVHNQCCNNLFLASVTYYSSRFTCEHISPLCSEPKDGTQRLQLQFTTRPNPPEDS